MPKSLRSSAGKRPINAIVGWTNMMLTVWEAEQPRSIFVAWDTLGVDTYRHQLLPTYQGGRIFDAALVKTLDWLQAAAAIAETNRGGRSLLLTTDRDAYQLVSDSVMVLAPRSGVRDLMRIGPH